MRKINFICLQSSYTKGRKCSEPVHSIRPAIDADTAKKTLDEARRDTSITERWILTNIVVPKSKIPRLFRRQRYHPIYFQRVETLLPAGYLT